MMWTERVRIIKKFDEVLAYLEEQDNHTIKMPISGIFHLAEFRI